MLGAVGLTVKNCRFENVGFGVWTEYAGSSDFYIADNLFLGRDDRFRLIGWTGPLWASAGPYGSHLLTSYYAIKVYGPGHVIAHNAIAYFHDGIGISTYGTPEQDPDRRASSIDIYNNDMHMLNDDFVETDGGVHNIRVFNNRGVNAAHGGYSSQPVFGGPVYFIRNILVSRAQRRGVQVLRQAGRPVRLPQHDHRRADGARPVVQHALPQQPVSRPRHARPRHHDLGQRDRRLQLRLQRLPPEQRRRRAVHVAGSRHGQAAYEPTPDDWKSFATLAELRAATGQETHGIEVDFDIFERMTPPDPAKRHAVYHAMDLNFALKPDSKAVDAGVLIPTVNDGFAGRAPDLGALEFGKPAPQYGPRWLDWQPFYR